MSFEVAYQVRQSGPQSDLRELDVVALTAAATSDDGDAIPAGAEGTVVSVYHQGSVYVVEFDAPPGALASVGPESLSLVARADVWPSPR